MVGDVFTANSVEVIYRGMQADGAGNIRSACFEPMRRRLPGALMIVDGQNHFSAAAIGRRFLEAFGAAIQNSETGRAAHFMARKSEEIAPDLLPVEGPVTRALGGIDERNDATLSRAFAVICYRIDRAEPVRDVSHGQQLDIAGEILIELRKIEQTAVAINRQKNQFSPDPLGQQLPRNDVAVVLHLGEQNFIAALDVLRAPGLRDEIDPFGGAA